MCFFRIIIHFQDHKGNPIKSIEAQDGDNILDLAHEYDIDLEGTCVLERKLFSNAVVCSRCL